jgi:hypothetical protein
MFHLSAHGISVIAPSTPGVAGGSFAGLQGDSISGTISGLTPHTWIDDVQGLFHTTTDLHAEWVGFYQQMIDGHGASLTPVQRLEGQAEAVFLNTGINKLPVAEQNVFREDVQREFDAISAAMQIDQQTLGINPNAPLTESSYIALGRAIQNNPQLEELAVQGHGLNSPILPRYAGYTNQFQNNIDHVTKYLGGGPDKGENALKAYFDDYIMTHLPFPVIARNGHLLQLNQNGAVESGAARATVEANVAMFGKTLTAKDFGKV